jgi:predicted amidohydrolase
MKTLRIAVAQPLCQPGDVAGNLARMEPLVREAAAAGARLVLFSEGGVTGYEDAARSLDRVVTLGDATCTALHDMARRHRVVIAAGFMEREGPYLHITHGMFYPDGRFGFQRKAGLGPPENGMADYRPGPVERTVFEVDGVRCAISICADSGLPRLWERLQEAGVQLHLCPSAGCGKRSWGFTEASLADPAVLDNYIQKVDTIISVKDAIRSCIRYRIAAATCNQMADDGVGYFHPGHSCIIDRTGELAALIPGTFVFEHLRPRVAWGDISSAGQSGL